MHAIGDRANREALDAFEADARRLGSRSGCGSGSSTRSCSRPRICPASPSSASPCSVQFSHAPSDRDLADQYWAGKTDGAYAFRSLLDSGAVVANGSDAPIEELDPLAGIRAGVRRTIDERAAWHPEQALTVEQAFHATCVAPAWLAGDERRRGTLIPGHAADLVVLDRDPWDDLDARGRRDDGRRPLGAQPAALGLRRVLRALYAAGDRDAGGSGGCSGSSTTHSPRRIDR